MKRKLILHIGAHRTATSALQDYLHSNFLPIQDKGFFYPFKVRRHIKLMNDLFAGKRNVATVSNTLTTRADSRGKDIHTIILSDEDVCLRRDLSILAEFKEHFDVKVVYTLRRQDSWLESWFFQNIKWQWNAKLSHCNFDQFMAMREDFHWIHYDRFVTHLEKLFGQDNIILNIHEKQQMQGGPIETFCNSIGLTDRDGLGAPAHINESFSPMISEFMRQLPLDAAPVPYRNMLTGTCAAIDRRLNGGGKKQSERLLPHADRKALLDKYAAGNTAIAQRYFGRDTLFLDPLPGPDAPLANMALPSDTNTLMAEFVAPLIKAMIEDHKKTQPDTDAS